MLNMAPGVECRLEVDAANSGMLDGEFDDLTDLVFVDAPFDRRNERDMQTDLSQTVEGPNLFFQNVWLTTKNPVSFRVETVELEIKRWTYLVQLFEKTIVLRNAFPICVDHHKMDAARLCGSDEIDDLRVDGRFTAGELNDFRSALRSNEVVQHLFNFFHGEVEAWPGFGKTEWAIHVADAVHFDDAQAGVLLVVGAEAAVIGAAILASASAYTSASNGPHCGQRLRM